MAKHFFQLMKKLLFSKGFLPAEKDFEQSRPLNTANFLGYSMKVARCSKKARRNKKNHTNDLFKKWREKEDCNINCALNLVKLYKGQVTTKYIKLLSF